MPNVEEIYLPSTLYLWICNTLRENLDVVPHLERTPIVPGERPPYSDQWKEPCVEGQEYQLEEWSCYFHVNFDRVHGIGQVG